MKERKLAIVNGFGNVDLTRTRLDRRYVHVKGKRLQPLCRKLGIRFAEAVVDFEEHRTYGWKPVTDGVVVSSKSAQKLRDAIQAREQRNPPEKRAAARRRRFENRCRRLNEAGISDPSSHTARWFLRNEIDAEEAQLIQFKAYYRHEHSDYDTLLTELRDSSEFGSVASEARDLATEQPIPHCWKEYLDKYDFPHPEVAAKLAAVLKDPRQAHPIWFCEAILAVKRSNADFTTLDYESIRYAIEQWRGEREFNQEGGRYDY